MRYRYYTVIDGVRREFFPAGVKDLQTVFTRVSEARYTHNVEFSSPLLLTGDDFRYIYNIETSNKRCGDIHLLIEKFCGQEYVPFMEGKFRVIDGTYDVDKCSLEIEITSVNPYFCFDYNAKREINIFDAKPYTQRANVRVLRGNIVVLKRVWENFEEFKPYDESFFGGEDPRLKCWEIYRNELWLTYRQVPRGQPSDLSRRQFVTFYCREEITLPCNQNPPIAEGWILVDDNCPVNRKYARRGIFFNYTPLLPNNYTKDNVDEDPLAGSDENQAGVRNFNFELKEPHIIFNYGVMGLNDTPDRLDNGIRLTEVLEYFINKFCGISVRSNFFQHNPDKTFDEAYPLLPKDQRTFNAILFQKSDVKRLNAANNATKGITTIEKLVNAVCAAFNLQYRIEDGYFNIEHVSYWERSVELDLTEEKYQEYMSFKNKYSYDTSKLPQFEEFKMMEAGYADFVGQPIEYFGTCVSIEESEKTKIFDAGIITTDVEYCINNPSSDSVVSDDGFVIVAANIDGGAYYALRFNGMLDGEPRLNNPFSWAYLMDAYHKFNRPQKSGLMNNRFQEFYTTMPIKKQDKITIPFCCGDELKLTGLVRTGLGDGIIDRATLNHNAETLDLEILHYNQYQEFYCSKPVGFRLNKVTADRFFFDVELLDCSIGHIVQVESTLPNGNTLLSDFINTSCSQTIDIGIPPGPGEYKFRLRKVCNDGVSEWSDYLNIGYADPASCAMLPPLTFVKVLVSTNGWLWYFKFTEPMFNASVDVEVIKPNSEVYSEQNIYMENDGTDVTIRFATGNPRHSGTHRFKFRRRCLAGAASLYSTELTRTV